jgi:phosphoglycerate dehydrogenase-like enzyme
LNEREGVGIDVYKTEPFPTDDSFLKHPKVICTPHVGGTTQISYTNMVSDAMMSFPITPNVILFATVMNS